MIAPASHACMIADRCKGMLIDKAFDFIEANESIARIVCNDGIYRVAARDIKPNRINLTVLHNIVVNATVG